jgi:hypothetical protein
MEPVLFSVSDAGLWGQARADALERDAHHTHVSRHRRFLHNAMASHRSTEAAIVPG